MTDVWLLISAMLVMIMHLGFACLEGGSSGKLTPVLMKNTAVLLFGILIYFLIGYPLMYGWENMDLFWKGGHIVTSVDHNFYSGILFQAMFAATAATIVSGAVIDKQSLGKFLFVSFILILLYSVVGALTWGGGLLSQWGFYDFAGSTIVHAVGGAAALAYLQNLPAKHAIYREGVELRTIGVFLIWFGWYGFNGGSVLSTGDMELVSKVLVNTTIAACGGGMVGMGCTLKIEETLNGILAGLVGITAGADTMSPLHAVLVGGVAGMVYLGGNTFLLRKLRLNDIVGVVPVHLFAGIWGTVAVGIFGSKAGWQQLLIQIGGCSLIIIIVYTIIYLITRTNTRKEVSGG